MALTKQRKEQIKLVLKTSLRNKFLNYIPETNNMPFHYRLLGKDRMILYSFIQSLNTTFGTSIYEPVAKALATERFKRSESQVRPYNYISEEAHREIQKIMTALITAEAEPNKLQEIEKIRSVCKKGEMNKVKLTKVDIWLESSGGEIFLIDFKTAKPNISNFKDFKRQLLEWIAAETARNPGIKIKTLIGIPYNPYEPDPYNRWTIRGMLDLDHELLVADELWDFIGGEGTYTELLDCFEEVGIELRPEIDAHFEKFK